MTLTEKAAILWPLSPFIESFIPDLKTMKEINDLPIFELTQYENFIEKRWTVKETVPQIGAKQAKENSRRRAVEVDQDE